ncbi:hypothetical protein HDE76_000705 [Rhodanobacter sp. ANJX3]|uniref:hypothetical protein n=1 Tax=Rhodanobacter sp. ANJX3 TaxID=2723083 RepID=UPI001608F099|nr:hypothetical protein [Rhodanobacter sp. ANJX3]MBB5357523.1 hypothetical protein [Rhodanobacter sp. ANJX3]
MNKLIQFVLAGIVETITQKRLHKSRERAARHNLQLAKYAAAIRKMQTKES